MDVTLELDVMGADEGPWEREGLEDLGTVMVELVEPSGPAGGNPVARVSGPKAAVVVWLLVEYVAQDDSALDEAMGLLRPVEDGGARVAG